MAKQQSTKRTASKKSSQKDEKSDPFTEAIVKVGRPPKFSNPDELAELIREYFIFIQGEAEEKEGVKTDDKGNIILDENGKTIKETKREFIREPEPPTVTGLTLFVGFAHKSSLYDYAKKEGFSDLIKTALTMIEKHHEVQLTKPFSSTIGHLFVLKNMGWKTEEQTINPDTGKETLGQMPVIKIEKT